MGSEFRNRIHRSGRLIHSGIEGVVLTSSMSIGMLTLLIVFLGAWVSLR